MTKDEFYPIPEVSGEFSHRRGGETYNGLIKFHDGTWNAAPSQPTPEVALAKAQAAADDLIAAMRKFAHQYLYSRYKGSTKSGEDE